MKKCSESESFIKRARSLLVVVSTPPVQSDFENFTAQVREYNSKEPFFIKSPDIFKNYTKVSDKLKIQKFNKYNRKIP